MARGALKTAETFGKGIAEHGLRGTQGSVAITHTFILFFPPPISTYLLTPCPHQQIQPSRDPRGRSLTR